MRDQLVLLPDHSSETGDVSWELDEHTRELGRHGLAAARQALRQASTRRAA